MTEPLLSVVLVDEADDVRALVRARLRLAQRFEVVAEGASGADAVAAAQRHRPDLMLLDVSMPGMEGLDAIDRVRAASPNTRIVLFSGCEEDDLARKALELGAVDCLDKSVPLDVLVDRLLKAAGQEPTGEVLGLEEALRESEERFRLLVEGVADYAIFMLDPRGHIVSWNQGAERIKGYAAHEIIGQHFEVFYTEQDQRLGHPAHELTTAAAEGRYEEEGWRVRKDGTTFWANVVITSLRSPDGQLLGFAKVTRDITERMEASAVLAAANESLAAMADERTEFLAVTAHELRTPVAVINGFARTLVDHWEQLADAERLEMVDAVARGGERLGRLVEDLLTASRLESGALGVWLSRFDLGELCAEVARDLGATMGVSIELELDSSPVIVEADRGRVQQMIGNYVTNALRYGRPPVTIAVAATSAGGEARVVDEGPGVPSDLRARLFQRFVRGTGTDGTGLGLFIVRELARRHGGDAWYEDRPGGGACFVLSLPGPRTGGGRRQGRLG